MIVSRYGIKHAFWLLCISVCISVPSSGNLNTAIMLLLQGHTSLSSEIIYLTSSDIRFIHPTEWGHHSFDILQTRMDEVRMGFDSLAKRSPIFWCIWSPTQHYWFPIAQVHHRTTLSWMILYGHVCSYTIFFNLRSNAQYMIVEL